MNDPAKPNRRGAALAALFALALLMGPGPGIYLVNPDPSDSDAARFILGVPIVYAWAAFWFGVQALVILLAYRLLWRDPEKDAAP